MTSRYLLPLSVEAFDGIPIKAVPRTVRLKDPSLSSLKAIEWTVEGYCQKLIDKNEALQTRFREFEGRLHEPEFWEGLTQGQRLLYLLPVLDGQVRNGGITQFFWNCPDLVFEVSDALKALNVPVLSEQYDKALEVIIGNQEHWIELRKQSFRDPNNPDWAQFQESYDLLDLDWFDVAYFDKYSYDDNGKSTLQNPGLASLLMEMLAANVKSHKDEFIRY